MVLRRERRKKFGLPSGVRRRRRPNCVSCKGRRAANEKEEGRKAVLSCVCWGWAGAHDPQCVIKDVSEREREREEEEEKELQ